MSTPKNKVLFVIPGDSPVQIQGSPHLERLKPYGEVVMYTDRPASEEEKLRRVKDADVILNTRGAVKWPRESLAKLPGLRLIATCSIGTDMIDLDAARELGVTVCNQPGRTARIVAEHAIALMFATAKRVAYQTAQLKAGHWARMDNVFLQGKTLGIVGTGDIGSGVARLGNALGMRVLAWTYHPGPARAQQLGVTYVSLDDLLRQSDVVSLHVRLSPESAHLIGKRELAMMKPGALLINVARAGVVDTGALVEALDSGHLAGAGIDVFDQEPVSKDAPIVRCEQVVLTPHIADVTPEGVELLNEGVVDNAIAFLEGRPQNVVV
ncbi:MAG: glycerate dehydrogenase [SAR202 cluster bacterium]|nr:glycerate dehydrogenase [SAR202 cluster bacterium]